MKDYDIMYKRRSVRKYYDKLDKDLYNNLQNFIKNGINPLLDNINYQIKIVDKEYVKTKSVVAPQYILFYSDKSEGYKINAGFIMQQIDLYLQSNGAGTCWLGLASVKDNIVNQLNYVIMLATGMTNTPLRADENDYKRKALDEVGNLTDKDLLKAIRVAPSAVNKQPWYYKEINDKKISVYVKRNNIYKFILKKYDDIDIGISLCHLNKALKQKGRNIESVILNDAENGIISLILD